MKIEVLFFAIARDLAGASHDTLEVAAGTGVSEALEEVASRYPKLAPALAGFRVAVNEEFADAAQRLREGDVVAILPPVSGG